MTQPKQPPDHPAPEQAPQEGSPTTPHTEDHGVPEEAHEGEATAWPGGGREQSEKVPGAT